MNGLTQEMFAAQRNFYERQCGNLSTAGADASMIAEKFAQENIALKVELAEKNKIIEELNAPKKTERVVSINSDLK